MKIDGGCHCGAITYEAEIDPGKVGICHCSDCQTLSGTAYRTILPIPAADFHIQTGTPKVYVKLGDSGAKRAQAFCGDCGAPIYASDAGPAPAVYNLRLGTARQRDQLPPKWEVWCRSALPWLPKMEALPKKEKQ